MDAYWPYFLLLIPLVGLILLFTGIIFRMKQSDKLKLFCMTTGKVVEMGTRQSNKTTLYYPIVEYKVKDTIYRYVESIASKPAGFAVGDSVEILYNADSPYDAFLRKNMFWFANFLIIFSTGMIFFGVAAFTIVMISPAQK